MVADCVEQKYDLISHHSLKTPVLFLVFNRLNTTKQVFESIRQAKPPRLYVAADGAREFEQGETQKVEQIRDYVVSNIDWPCEVKTLFRESNLGCKIAVSEAITWFFDHEEQGIILEDDCLPSQSFFWFCEQLLGKYKNDMRIWHISGSVLQNLVGSGESYHFSLYPGIWGWATWRNRWEKYDVKALAFEGRKSISHLAGGKISLKYWIKVFSDIKKGKIDTWDFQWILTVWLNNGLSITPNINQVSNIGFGLDATHTKNQNSSLGKLRVENIQKIIHPSEVTVNNTRDEFLLKNYFFRPNIFKRVISKIVRMF